MAKANMPKVTGDQNDAILADRMRVSAILESTEGLTRPKLAMQLALRSSMDVQSALETLRSTPVASPYVEAMNAQGPVNIESYSSGPVSSADDKKAKRLAEIQANVPKRKAS